MGIRWMLPLLAVVAGCFPTNDELQAKLVTRAAFDLNCKDVETKPLEFNNGTVTSYGVTGCGRRASYVLSPNATWVLNNEDGKPAAGGAQALTTGSAVPMLGGPPPPPMMQPPPPVFFPPAPAPMY